MNSRSKYMNAWSKHLLTWVMFRFFVHFVDTSRLSRFNARTKNLYDFWVWIPYISRYLGKMRKYIKLSVFSQWIICLCLTPLRSLFLTLILFFLLVFRTLYFYIWSLIRHLNLLLPVSGPKRFVALNSLVHVQCNLNGFILSHSFQIYT